MNPKTQILKKDILTYEELPVIRGFCIEEFGEGVAELKKMQQFYKRNSKIFVKVSHVIRKNLNKTTKLIGFYDLLPLTKEAADLFDNDELSGCLF